MNYADVSWQLRWSRQLGDLFCLPKAIYRKKRIRIRIVVYRMIEVIPLWICQLIWKQLIIFHSVSRKSWRFTFIIQSISQEWLGVDWKRLIDLQVRGKRVFSSTFRQLSLGASNCYRMTLTPASLSLQTYAGNCRLQSPRFPISY